MSSDWPHVRLGDHIDSCLGKMLDAKKNKGLPQPYLGNSNVRWGKFDQVNLAEMRFEPHEEERYGLAPGDLVVCEGGEPGRCAIWTGSKGMKIQKALHRIRPKSTLNNHYLYYWFRYAEKLGLLEPYFTGTTIKHLTGKAVTSLKVPLPPIEVQVRMVELLRSLDGTIENIRNQNTALESIVKTLFRSWFIDFDPVHAKVAGKEPEAMSAELAALFPSELEDHELGANPKGWSVGRIGDIGQNIRALGKPTEIPPNTPYIGLEHMPRRSLSIIEWGTAATVESGKFWFKPSDVLFGKLRPYFHKVGIANVKGVCSTDILVIRPKEENWHAFLVMHLFSKSFIEHATQLSDGARMPRTNWSDTAAYKFSLPPVVLAGRFNKLVQPMFSLMMVNVEKIRLLASLRDHLLPRLISGKLRIEDAKASVEAMTLELEAAA